MEIFTGLKQLICECLWLNLCVSWKPSFFCIFLIQLIQVSHTDNEMKIWVMKNWRKKNQNAKIIFRKISETYALISPQPPDDHNSKILFPWFCILHFYYLYRCVDLKIHTSNLETFEFHFKIFANIFLINFSHSF